MRILYNVSLIALYLVLIQKNLLYSFLEQVQSFLVKLPGPEAIDKALAETEDDTESKISLVIRSWSFLAYIICHLITRIETNCLNSEDNCTDTDISDKKDDVEGFVTVTIQALHAMILSKFLKNALKIMI